MTKSGGYKNPYDKFRVTESVARIFYYIIAIIPSQDVLNILSKLPISSHKIND